MEKAEVADHQNGKENDKYGKEEEKDGLLDCMVWTKEIEKERKREREKEREKRRTQPGWAHPG